MNIQTRYGAGIGAVLEAYAETDHDVFDTVFCDKTVVSLQIGDIILTPVCAVYTSAMIAIVGGIQRARCVVREDVQSVIE